MAPIFSIFVLSLMALVSASVSGVDQSKNLFPGSAQATAVPITIKTRETVSITRPADKVEAEIAVHGCHPDPSEAEKRTGFHLHDLQTRFNQLGMNASVGSSMSVGVDEGGGWDLYYLYGEESSCSGNSEAAEGFCGYSTLLVTVHDPDLLRHLSGNLSTSNTEAKLQHLDWHLSDATNAKQKIELRRKAWEEMQQTAEEYAAILGVGQVMPRVMDELYNRETIISWDRGRHRAEWFRNWDGEGGLRVPLVEMTGEFGFEFITT